MVRGGLGIYSKDGRGRPRSNVDDWLGLWAVLELLSPAIANDISQLVSSRYRE